MSSFFQFLHTIWGYLFGWAPSSLGIILTILVGLAIVIIIIKIIAFILDAIPFL